MSEPDPRRWARFALSLLAFLTVAVAAPAVLLAASRARFGSANPLTGAEPPWRWGSSGVGDALSGPIADDTVIDGIVRLSLCVVWVAVAVIVVTTIVEVVHAVRHRGLAFPDVRGVGWAQRVGRFVAVGLVAVLPVMTSATSLASTLGARSVAAVSIDGSGVATPGAVVVSVLPSGGSSTATLTAPTGPTEPTEPTGAVHVVAAGESIYSIALGLAGGDQRQVIEIADAIIDANLGAAMPGGQRFTNPAYVEEGWALQIPGPVAGARAHAPDDAVERVGAVGADEATTYVVERGDTLWDIADEHLGDPAEWTEIWERNEGDDMGGGRTFDDPDLIVPGWELDLTDDDPAPAAMPDGPTDADDSDEPVTPSVDTAADTPSATAVDRGPAVDSWDAAPDDVDVKGPLPLTPTASNSPTSIPASTTGIPASTTTTIGPPTGGPAAGSDDPGGQRPAPDAPSPIRIEHAALLAAGVLALVGVRRRQRLRAAMPRHRVPEPRDEVARTERRLRTIDAGERVLRVDVACRAAARSLIGSASQIGWVEVSVDGDVELRLTAPATLSPPFTGERQTWRLGGEVPIEILGEDARQVGQPCVALVQLGVTTSGSELLVDLEACGVLSVTAGADQADEVVTAIAAALASSQFAEVAHLVGVSLPHAALLEHRNGHIAGSADAAMELAGSLAGTTAMHERSSFELRSLRTGGEMWEPAVVLLRSGDDRSGLCLFDSMPAPGHGLAVVTAEAVDAAPARLVAGDDGWALEAFETTIALTPIGVNADELAEITELLVDAERRLEPVADQVQWADDPLASEHRDPAVDAGDEDLDAGRGDDLSPGPGAEPVDDTVRGPAGVAVRFEPRPHEIVVGLLGGVEVTARTGEPGAFERSKTVELIAWLATHRDRATRSGARTALWDLEVRDATFANVVSEARRALARLVAPPEDEEWVARTLTEQLPVHDLVVTDADLVEERLARARVQPPSQAIETLRPAVELVRDLPFAGTSYLWPDAEGITSNLVLLAITATAEFAAHALSLGDTDDVFWATGKGLRVLPGHEELIALRMQAHARAGDLAGVRQEWESYERVLVADAWSDGEPSPKLLALRRQLLSPATS